MKTPTLLVLTLLMASVATSPAADAKALWDKQCAKCHGADGKGQTKAGKKAEAKDMTDAKWQANLTDERAFKSIKEGMKDGDKVIMKPIEGATDDDVKALVAYTRAFKK
jgi:cytochrome c553